MRVNIVLKQCVSTIDISVLNIIVVLIGTVEDAPPI